VYLRGALTLQALRTEIGDAAFFKVLRRWAQSRQDGNVTTREFIAFAEKISGRQLDELFDVWLSTPGKPATSPAPRPAAAPVAASARGAVPVAAPARAAHARG